MGAFQSDFALSGLDGTTGVLFEGLTGGDSLGFSATFAGDLNGDGIADLAIGAPYAGPGSDRPGETYIVYGTRNGFPASFDLAMLNGSTGFVLDGVGTNDSSGWSVSGAGDVNDDGVDDLIVGARFASPNAVQSAGAGYVVYGTTAGFPSRLDLGTLNGTNGFRLNGEAEFDYLGWDVSNAGDVNADGVDDVIISAYKADRNGLDRSGSVYVVFGDDATRPADVALSTINGNNGFRIDGEGIYDLFGQSVSAAGDVNGDGFGDVIVGAYFNDANGVDSGAAYVIFGRDTVFPAAIGAAALNGANGFKISGGSDDWAGSEVSAADFNNDGYSDLIISAPGGYNTASGAVYILYGKRSGFGSEVDLATLDGTSGIRIDRGSESDVRLSGGRAAGDLNADGFADLVLSAWLKADDGVTEISAAYVLFGSASGFASDIALSELNGINGFRVLGKAGLPVGGAKDSGGDINGDGIDDLVFGSPGASPNGTSSGAAYVLFGNDRTQTGTELANGLIGTALGDTLIGKGGDDYLSGLGGDDTFSGGLGDDEIVGGEGSDTVVFETATGVVADLFYGYSQSSDLGEDTLWSIENAIGGAGNDYFVGNEYDNRLVGGRGNDTLEGDLGDDVLDGGAGADTASFDNMYGRSHSERVFVDLNLVGPQNTGLGMDTLIGIENLIGGDGNDRLLGDANANFIKGNRGNDILSGGDGRDTLYGDQGKDVLSGGAGNDLLYGNQDDDLLEGAGGADSLFGGDGNDTIYGGADDDRLAGENGNDILEGGAGSDYLSGGVGNDTLDGGADFDFAQFGGSNDLTVDLRLSGAQDTGQGLDTLLNIEGLLGTSSGNDTLIGNDIGNSLYGYGGDDVLQGNGGNDRIVGGDGRDWAIFDISGSVTVDLKRTDFQPTGDGNDLLESIENIRSGSGNDQLFGDAQDNEFAAEGGNDYLLGGEGDDRLNGGAGDDEMDGESGSDWAIFATAADITVFLDATNGFATGEGSDTLRGIENVETGSGLDYLRGDDQANHLKAGAGNDLVIGRNGDDILDGGIGADTMHGGEGSDLYIVDNPGDVPFERIGEGRDTVRALINWTLGAEFERLELRGGATSAIGNALDNTLLGNGADNILNGMAGADYMVGGAGDDLFVVAAAGDRTVEKAGEGRDTVRAYIDWELDDHVERLELLGSAVAATGNALGNTLVGNGGDNILNGASGRDYIAGGGGDDILIGGEGDDWKSGGAGADLFVFSGLFGRDIILDFDPTEVGERVDLSEVNTVTGWSDLKNSHMSQSGADVLITTSQGEILLRNMSLNVLEKDDFLF